MARYLKFDRKLFGSTGQITLNRGDDWVLPGTIMELNGANLDPVDLTGTTGISGSFPGITGSVVPASATIIDLMCGKVQLSLPASASLLTQPTSIGCSPLIRLSGPQGVQTLDSIDPQPVVIQDPSYT